MSGTNTPEQAPEKRRNRVLKRPYAVWWTPFKKKILRTFSVSPEIEPVSASQQDASQKSSSKAGPNTIPKSTPALYPPIFRVTGSLILAHAGQRPGPLPPPIDDPASPTQIAAAGLVERGQEIPRSVPLAGPDKVQIRDPMIHDSTQKFCEPTQGPTEEPQNGTDSRCVGVANTLWDQALAGLDPKKRKFLPIDEGTSQLNIDRVIEVVRIKIAQWVEKRWKFRFGGRVCDLSERAESIISFLNKFKEIGDVAVQHDAGHAALPWAAIRLLLQVR